MRSVLREHHSIACIMSTTFDVTPNLEPVPSLLDYDTYRKLFPNDEELVDPLAYSRVEDDSAIYVKSSHGFVTSVKYAFS